MRQSLPIQEDEIEAEVGRGLKNTTTYLNAKNQMKIIFQKKPGRSCICECQKVVVVVVEPVSTFIKVLKYIFQFVTIVF